MSAGAGEAGGCGRRVKQMQRCWRGALRAAQTAGSGFKAHGSAMRLARRPTHLVGAGGCVPGHGRLHLAEVPQRVSTAVEKIVGRA